MKDRLVYYVIFQIKAELDNIYSLQKERIVPPK